MGSTVVLVVVIVIVVIVTFHAVAKRGKREEPRKVKSTENNIDSLLPLAYNNAVYDQRVGKERYITNAMPWPFGKIIITMSYYFYHESVQHAFYKCSCACSYSQSYL